MSLGTKIDALRRLHGLGKVDLAKAVGASRSAVYDWINDVRLPRDETTTAIAAVFSVPVWVLVDDGVDEAEAVRIYKNSQTKPASGVIQPRETPRHSARANGVHQVREVPVVRVHDILGRNWREVVSMETGGRLAATQSTDPYAFYLVGEPPESCIPGHFPPPLQDVPQLLLVEPSMPVRPGQLVLVDGHDALFLRRFVQADGVRELRALSSDQSTVPYSRHAQMAAVRQVTLDIPTV